MTQAGTGLDSFRFLEAPPSVLSGETGAERPLRNAVAAAALSASLITLPPTVTPTNIAALACGGELDGRDHQQSLAAFSARPAQERIADFRDALIDCITMSEGLLAQNEGASLNQQTLAYALTTLLRVISSLHLPAPLFLPLQNGGIGAEWHAAGMNIELRFRAPYNVYAVLEDARGAISPYHGRDPHLVRAYAALRELSPRVVS